MKGKHKIIVSTKRLKYEFELQRNLTIIQGDSATGKTTLVDMIRDFVNNPSGTPVELNCDKKCYVLEGALWKQQLTGITDGIVFIDEGNEFIKSSEFKFYDYFSTVGISQYKGFENIDEILFSESSICDLFERHSNKSQIVVPLKSIQEKLLNTFPYPINI